MTSTRTEEEYRGPAFWSIGLRPFFLGAALFAGMAVPAWVVLLSLLADAGPVSAARVWHVHEMLFGFLPAVMTGFLFTAIPNWTDRPPIRGVPLMGLFGLWVAGRCVMAVPSLDPVIAASIDGLFLVAVAAAVWREIAAGRSWGQAPIGVLISLYAMTALWFHVLRINGGGTGSAERLALGVIMLLLTVIGGRVTPSFTAEFLSERDRRFRPAKLALVDGLSILLTGAAVIAWMVAPESGATGLLFVGGGAAQLARLLRWHGWATWPEPLVFVLHVGYGWLAVSLLVMGGAILGFGLPVTDSVHALTSGAVGVMTLAIMTRASLGHTGRTRHAGPATVLMYVLVNLGAVLRVFGPATTLPDSAVFGLAALSWSGAYGLFGLLYGRFLLRPSLDE